MSENCCVMCGNEVPEGKQVCAHCLNKYGGIPFVAMSSTEILPSHIDKEKKENTERR